MLILMVAVNDPAGSAIALARAVNSLTSHTCRLVTMELRYNFMFAKDIHIPWLDDRGFQELGLLLRKADVLHFHMTADENVKLGPYPLREFARGRLVVHHHHGHPDFRGQPDKYRRKYAQKGRNHLLVSTPDLLELLPGSVWLPNTVPLDDEAYTPLPGKPATPVKVAHSPTRKDLKNTDDFLAAMAGLGGAALAEVIENTPHLECLARKRASHLLFDHLQGYYGVSSLEGLAMGLPVVAGIDDLNRRHILDFTGARRLPWVVSSRENLAADLMGLVRNAHRREEIGKASRRFMERYWTQERVVSRLLAFYESPGAAPA
jgi:glycosyltransferase involved in cell wall biosynthesis